MFADGLDERFTAAGARSLPFSLVRLAIGEIASGSADR
jgi:hypothetical protein